SRNKSQKLSRKADSDSRKGGSASPPEPEPMKTKNKSKRKEDYKKIILEIFRKHYSPERSRFTFTRPELVQAAAKIGLKVEEGDDEESTTKNIGDVVYTYRFRREFPKEILDTAP